MTRTGTYDVEAVRARFPALAEGAAHFDGPGGSQAPDVVADAVADTLRSAIANRGTVTAAERRAEHVVNAARGTAGVLLNTDPAGVIFGRSMTQLTFDMSRTLARSWVEGDELIVTSLDHDANIRPWVTAAEANGLVVRWAEFDPATGGLDTQAVAGLLTDRTRLVAVTGASNLLGSRPDVPAIAEQVHKAGALLYVDGVHRTPHGPVDLAALGADFYACSPYKFLGPHAGILAARPQLLHELRPDKLAPSTDAVPDRFELGTLPYEQLAGTTAAIEFLTDLVPGDGRPRERLTRSMRALAAHETAMRERLDAGLAEIPGVTTYGAPDRDRTPTVLFQVSGVEPSEAHRELAAAGVNAPAGSFYALEASRRLGLEDSGAIRAGVGPYTNESDVDRLLAGVAELAPRT